MTESSPSHVSQGGGGDKVVDVAVVGAGAAGLMAGIWAGRTNPNRRIVLLDGAKSLGAKILVAGGGRCNVTHHAVDESAYAGSSRKAIRNVLRRFDVPETVAFFREIGVTLKREEAGKLFPTTDSARTVLNALLQEAHRVGATIRHPCRVTKIDREQDTFLVRGEWGSLRTSRLILATGGKSLPKTGSDGLGYRFAQSLGHSVSERIFPALVPLTLDKSDALVELSGITLPATIELRSGNGKRLISFTDSTLITHFGLSGPSVLDISRYYLDEIEDDPDAHLTMNWLPNETAESLDQSLRNARGETIGRLLTARLPERLGCLLCAQVGVAFNKPIDQLGREKRRSLVRQMTEMPLAVTGHRGYTHAEVTAGGVPLSEIQLKTMASRQCPGLHLCGEICDVDGRIGGFNFQWAWASGFVAGISV
ncbi:MAG: NAD(P)/FAD-dependent oxidoreductase [Phycisphaerales bacterium]|nr:MAG: NAD(P)/FAD-dependent oxidoreductase [Phycisphaerales bacterium]